MMAVATRSGVVAGVIIHSDRGSTCTANDFTTLREKLDITQSMGRVGSCFDCGVVLLDVEHEVLSRHHFDTREEARKVVVTWVIDFYNGRRGHSTCGMLSPVAYEHTVNLEAA